MHACNTSPRPCKCSIACQVPAACKRLLGAPSLPPPKRNTRKKNDDGGEEQKDDSDSDDEQDGDEQQDPEARGSEVPVPRPKAKGKAKAAPKKKGKAKAKSAKKTKEMEQEQKELLKRKSKAYHRGKVAALKNGESEEDAKAAARKATEHMHACTHMHKNCAYRAMYVVSPTSPCMHACIKAFEQQ